MILRRLFAIGLVGTLVWCCDASRQASSNQTSDTTPKKKSDDSDEVVIEISPEIIRTDEPFCTEIHGLKPGALIRVRLVGASTNGEWRSEIEIAADDVGTVDLERDAPISGSYTFADPMGLLWSMVWTPVEDGTAVDYLALSSLTLGVLDEPGDELASTTIRRIYPTDELDYTLVSDDGLRADLFSPKDEPLGCVLVLGGSEGGRATYLATAIAFLGFEAFTPAYFGENGLPDELKAIPIESVEAALDDFLEICGRAQVSLWGVSKGAELAALLAAERPDAFNAVVLYSPSAVVNQGIYDGDGEISSWTIHGEALPFIPYDDDLIDYSSGLPDLFEGYRAPLSDRELVDAARIPVDRISAPILMVAGEDDGVWPAAMMAKMMETYRIETHTDHPDDQLRTYPGAGHGVSYPYWPLTISYGMVKGGTVEGDANATTDAWQASFEFLARANK